MKTLLNNLLNRNHENEADEHLNKGRAVMIRIKKRGTHREKPEKHYSLPLWKKCATYDASADRTAPGDRSGNCRSAATRHY